MKKPLKIALFGTSANPPHNRHMDIVRSIIKNKLADEVWIIPTGSHAFGKNLAPTADRLKMIRTFETAQIKIKDFEIKKKEKSYTIDTVKYLLKKYPKYEFMWVIGSDIVKNKEYKKWKNWNELSKLINFLVWPRDGYALSKSDRARFMVLTIKPKKDISSTTVRNFVSAGSSIHKLVPATIEKYIKKRKLYRQ